MGLLPSGFDDYAEKLGWTQTQKVAFLTPYYLLIGVYSALFALASRNIWVILVKQKEYKNLPIAMFYAFALIAIVLRLIWLIWSWTFRPVYTNIDTIQVVSKLCVGVVQDWITLELAIRIHNAKVNSDISESGKKQLRFIRRILFVFISLAFSAFCLAVIVSAHL